MPPMLSEQQRQAVDAIGDRDAVPVVDPRDNRTYYLVPADVYEQWHRVSGNDPSISGFYGLMDDVASREGWNDPEMSVYDALDPRKQA